MISCEHSSGTLPGHGSVSQVTVLLSYFDGHKKPPLTGGVQERILVLRPSPPQLIEHSDHSPQPFQAKFRVSGPFVCPIRKICNNVCYCIAEIHLLDMHIQQFANEQILN